MVQSPSWEANWSAASQEIPRISRNPKVHYRTHKRPPNFSILGKPNPVHIPTSHLLEIHPNIIHPSTPRSPQWSLSLWFPHQDPLHPLLLTHTLHMPSPYHFTFTYSLLGMFALRLSLPLRFPLPLPFHNMFKLQSVYQSCPIAYTRCPRRNVPDFGRVFHMLKYTDITQNTYIQSWTVTEIMATEKCGLLAVPRTAPFQLTRYVYTAHVLRDWNAVNTAPACPCKVFGTLRTTTALMRVFM